MRFEITSEEEFEKRKKSWPNEEQAVQLSEVLIDIMSKVTSHKHILLVIKGNSGCSVSGCLSNAGLLNLMHAFFLIYLNRVFR